MNKLLKSPILALITLAIIGAGCTSTPKALVVRLMPNDDQSEWRFSVNAVGSVNLTSSDKLTNSLARLHLKHGDMVIFGKLPQFKSVQARKTGDWLARYFDSKRVAIYVYPSTEREDVFSTPVYHWIAPFENPRGLKKASFFFEGKFLGDGMEGYQSMLRDIRRSHWPRIFVLGSLYNIDSGFGPFESPYEDQEQLLDQILKESATKPLLPSELPGL